MSKNPLPTSNTQDAEMLPSIIGLEVHIQLTNLKTKLFCGCSTDYRDAQPNAVTCPVCLGLPGSLPVINPKAITAAIRLATALHMTFPPCFVFSRKNYYYPDLAKNFQISQYSRATTPSIASGGYLDVYEGDQTHRIRINRIQIEEDPARLVHQGSIQKSPFTLIDYNRSGMGLIEVVTEPDLPSPNAAQQFLRQLRAIVENQEIANCDLEGSMRIDANISLKGHARVEIKNITGHREVKKALQEEYTAQQRLARQGRPIERVTKHWDAAKNQATTLRSKEEEHDYKYFPEPNLPIYALPKTFLAKIQHEMPETLEAKTERFRTLYQLPLKDVHTLVNTKQLASFFEETVALFKDTATVANWVNNILLGYLNDHEIELPETKLLPAHLVDILRLLDRKTITQRTAQILLEKAIDSGTSPNDAVKTLSLQMLSTETDLAQIIDTVLTENPDLLERAKKNPNVINRILGLVVMKTRKTADPDTTRRLIKERIDQHT